MHERDTLESAKRCEETMNSLLAPSGTTRTSARRSRARPSSAGTSWAWPPTSPPGRGSMPGAPSRRPSRPLPAASRSGMTGPATTSRIRGTIPSSSSSTTPSISRRPLRHPGTGLCPGPRISPPSPPPPPAARDAATGGPAAREGRSFFFDTLAEAEVVYLEIRQPAYWDGQAGSGPSFSPSWSSSSSSSAS